MITHYLQRFPDGTFINWGRNVTVNGVRGIGGAKYYAGEAAEVMALVVKYMSGKKIQKVIMTGGQII